MNISFAKSLGLAAICITTMQVDFLGADLKSQAIAQSKFPIAQGLRNTGIASPKPRERPLTPAEQAQVLIDVKELWAETAITTLVAANIMPAFTDSTFRPNDVVTPTQFRQILTKAFPNSSFTVNAPNQKLTKLQAIVTIVSGLKLKPSNTNLKNIFVDADQIPVSAQPSIAKAVAQKFIFNYPDVTVLNPNEPLTRIDLAALIYQGLVTQRKFPKLQNTDIAQVYLVGGQRQAIAINNTPRFLSPVPPEPQPSIQPQVPEVVIEPEVIRQNLRVPSPSTKQFAIASKSKGSPAISMTVPTGFGASAGNAFIGLGYQSSTRVNDGQDAGLSVGIGLGNPKDLVGLEIAFINYATGSRSSLFRNGGISLKFHRLIAENTSIALGFENAVTYGGADATSSVYGAISSILQLQDSPDQPFSSVAFTLGIGGGRFRSISDINTLKGTVNVFGSVAVRVLEPVSLIADWNGQTLSLGASIKPFRDIPLVITPGVTDIVGDNTNGTLFNGLNGLRFTLGVGYGIYF